MILCFEIILCLLSFINKRLNLPMNDYKANSEEAFSNTMIAQPLSLTSPQTTTSSSPVDSFINEEGHRMECMVIVMVGLPATGKTFTARNVARYLRWLGMRTRIFSVAHYRDEYLNSSGAPLSASFFDPSNINNLEKRTQIADKALDDLCCWLCSPIRDDGEKGLSRIAILDASNTQIARRRAIYEKIKGTLLPSDWPPVQITFMECIYDNWEGGEALQDHINELRLACPEYSKEEAHVVLSDFKKRIDFYRPFYSSIGEDELHSLGGPAPGELLPSYPIMKYNTSLIKQFNGGQHMQVHGLGGYLSTKILFYLMNLHSGQKRIFLLDLKYFTVDDDGGFDNVNCSTNSDFDDVNGSVKKDKEFNNNDNNINLFNNTKELQNICFLVDSCIGKDEEVAIWTETSPFGQMVGDTMEGRRKVWNKPQLRARDPGDAPTGSDGDDSDVESFKGNPYYHRHPRSESYHDVSSRLANVMMEAEGTRENILIIADRSVLRCIYAYFCEVPNAEIPFIGFDSAHMIELVPKAYGVYERKIPLGGCGGDVLSIAKNLHPILNNSIEVLCNNGGVDGRKIMATSEAAAVISNLHSFKESL